MSIEEYKTEEVRFWKSDFWKILWAVIRKKSVKLEFSIIHEHPEDYSDASSSYFEGGKR